MKMCLKKPAVILMSGFLLTSAIIVPPTLPFVIEAEAHSGNTDSHGGHRDSHNANGLGSYHYHCGGHPAHLHTNGVCPHATSDAGTNPASQKQVPESKVSVPETTTVTVEPGWKEGSAGWWYCTSNGQYYKDYWQSIDSQWYYFSPDRYVVTSWYCRTDHYYCLASDSHMMTGEHEIDGEHCCFNADGSPDGTTSYHGSGHHTGHHNQIPLPPLSPFILQDCAGTYYQ